MKQSFGLYRRRYGSKIVESFYDYDTKTIGPYTIDVEIQYNESVSVDSFSRYRYYEVMQQYDKVLAVFNNGNYCFAVITEQTVELIPYDKTEIYKKYNLPIFQHKTPIQLPNYSHIGFEKTYQECKAVYSWPWYLLGDLDTGQIFDYECKLSGTPLVDPPLSLYKYLLDTDYDAVYYDFDARKPVFIKH